MFNCTVNEADSCFPEFAGITMLVVCWDFSPSSTQYAQDVKKELKDNDNGVMLKILNGEDALNFCTKNGIISGAGAIKVFRKEKMWILFVFLSLW